MLDDNKKYKFLYMGKLTGFGEYFARHRGLANIVAVYKRPFTANYYVRFIRDSDNQLFYGCDPSLIERIDTVPNKDILFVLSKETNDGV